VASQPDPAVALFGGVNRVATILQLAILQLPTSHGTAVSHLLFVQGRYESSLFWASYLLPRNAQIPQLWAVMS
jgi:hypothetical protein